MCAFYVPCDGNFIPSHAAIPPHIVCFPCWTLNICCINLRDAHPHGQRERQRTCPTISKCKKGLAEEAIYSNKRGTTVARFHKVHKCKLAQHCNRLARKETLGRWVVAAVQLWTARLHKDAWFPFSRALRPENAAASSCPPRI